jgi:ABC-type nickel/cobalt efflux system permease component RcnA
MFSNIARPNYPFYVPDGATVNLAEYTTTKTSRNQERTGLWVLIVFGSWWFWRHLDDWQCMIEIAADSMTGAGFQE